MTGIVMLTRQEMPIKIIDKTGTVFIICFLIRENEVLREDSRGPFTPCINYSNANNAYSQHANKNRLFRRYCCRWIRPEKGKGPTVDRQPVVDLGEQGTRFLLVDTETGRLIAVK